MNNPLVGARQQHVTTNCAAASCKVHLFHFHKLKRSVVIEWNYVHQDLGVLTESDQCRWMCLYYLFKKFMKSLFSLQILKVKK